MVMVEKMTLNFTGKMIKMETLVNKIETLVNKIETLVNKIETLVDNVKNKVKLKEEINILLLDQKILILKLIGKVNVKKIMEDIVKVLSQVKEEMIIVRKVKEEVLVIIKMMSKEVVEEQ